MLVDSKNECPLKAHPDGSTSAMHIQSRATELTRLDPTLEADRVKATFGTAPFFEEPPFLSLSLSLSRAIEDLVCRSSLFPVHVQFPGFGQGGYPGIGLTGGWTKSCTAVKPCSKPLVDGICRGILGDTKWIFSIHSVIFRGCPFWRSFSGEFLLALVFWGFFCWEANHLLGPILSTGLGPLQLLLAKKSRIPRPKQTNKWLWVKIMCPKWTPAKRHQALKPAFLFVSFFFWLCYFDPYPNDDPEMHECATPSTFPKRSPTT